MSLKLQDKWIVAVFLIAFLLRLAYFLEVRDNPFFLNPQLDSQVYDNWAWEIAQGDWKGGEKAFFMSPFYAYFLAVIYKVFGHTLDIVRILQIFSGSLTTVITYLIGRELFGKRAGIISAFLGSLYAYSVFMDVELLKNSFAAFSVTLAFYTALMARKERLKMFWFISGLVMGLSVINQPNVLLLLPVFALWAVGGQQKEKRELIPVLAFVLGAVLTVAPVTIRNYVAEKDFVLVTNAGGLVFFQGNNEKADGAEGTSALIELTPSQLDEQASALAEKALGKKLNSSEVSRYWLSLGLKFISHHPLSFVKLTLKKALMFWNWYEVPDNLDFYYFKRFSKVLSFLPVSFGIIAPLSMLGLVMTYGEWRKHLFGYGVIFVFMISVIMFIVTGRYRLTILPLLSVYAGHAMDVTYNLFSQKSYKKVLLWGCLFMGLWAFSNVTVLQYPQENFQVLLGNIYMERGQYDKALKEYSEALKSLPYTVSSRTAYALCLEKNNLKDAALKEYRQLLYYQMVPAVRADIYLAIGLILFDKRDRKGAREAYENALRYEENHAEALNNLAWLYLTDNEMPEARRYAEKALALRPSSPEFMDTFGMVLMKERKYKEAVEYFRRALSKMPDSAEIKQHLNDALKLSG